MSGLAHFLEDEGISTVIIALVRLHAEKMRPPRALAVPFPLGRPLGIPVQPDMQRQVLDAALNLLDTVSEPGSIVDFTQSQSEHADLAWESPANLGGPGLEEEVQSLLPLYESAKRATKRTTVGVSRLALGDAASYVSKFDSDQPFPNPRRDMADLAMLRFAADDLKAAYFEAAAHGRRRPSADQLNDWLWNKTILAASLRAIRAASFDDPDSNRRAIGGSSLVPRRFANVPA